MSESVHFGIFTLLGSTTKIYSHRQQIHWARVRDAEKFYTIQTKAGSMSTRFWTYYISRVYAEKGDYFPVFFVWVHSYWLSLPHITVYVLLSCIYSQEVEAEKSMSLSLTEGTSLPVLVHQMIIYQNSSGVETSLWLRSPYLFLRN